MASPGSILALLLAAALAISACGGPARPSASPVSSPSAGESAGVTDTPGPSSDASQEAPGESAAASDPAAPSAVAACAGSAANRSFFEDAAGRLSWPVYCAVLPGDWQVQDGSYREASGGRLRISYVRTGGGRIELREGAWCAATPDSCNPSGADAGEARFGDRSARAISLDPGGFAVVADGGAEISWVLVADGLDLAAVLEIAAALIPVARP